MKNYKELQELIKKYEQTKIWELVDSDDIFRLDDFEEDIYISIMGKAGLDYGISIYYGKQDLLSQMDISFGQYEYSPDAFIRLRAYKISLGNPGNMLTDDDKKSLKKNSIKLKNVVFRLDAGKLPRIVTEQECIFLIAILKRIIEVSNYIIYKNLDLESVDIEYMYSFSKIENEITHKKVKWPTLKYEFINQNRLKKELINKGTWIQPKGELNIGMLYTPKFVSEKMIYPLMIIIHNSITNMIIDIMIIKEEEKSDIANNILTSLIDKKILPTKISFNSNEITDICKEIIKEYKVLFRVEENLEILFDIWEDMFNTM